MAQEDDPKRAALPKQAKPLPAVKKQPGAASAPTVFEVLPPRPYHVGRHRSKSGSAWLWAALGLLVLVAGGLAACGYYLWPGQSANERLLARIDDQRVDEQAELRVPIKLTKAGDSLAPRLSLVSGPKGLSLDETEQAIVWRPTEADGPGPFEVVVAAEPEGESQRRDQRKFKIVVNKVDQPPIIEPIDEQTVEAGRRLSFRVVAKDPRRPQEALRYRFLGETHGASLDEKTGLFAFLSDRDSSGRTLEFEVAACKTGQQALSAARRFSVRVTEPTADVVTTQPPAPAPVEEPKVEPTAPPPTKVEPVEEVDKIAELLAANKLLDRREYPTLRRAHAERFEREHLAQIKQGLGADHEKVAAWLQDHAELKEELYTAIDPKHDQMPRVFRVLGDLIAKYPNETADFGELAISLAVVWDDDRALYDYRHHQARTHAAAAGEPLGALENFQYLSAGDRVLQRVRFMPWEFLVHLVDHRTPLDERRWAVTTYLPARTMFGRCYSEVPYDHGMLKGDPPRLTDRPYTLANLRQFGGVCAMQADFASRVGKSLAVPAAYVRGEARSGDLHAWVMWVELKSASKDGINFTLESHGRYSGDKYYVGTLEDPHTGRQITDRQLELRLHTVGVNPRAKRHAELVMRAFPALRAKAGWDVKGELAFLNNVIQLSPGNEAAWRAVAALSKDGRIEKVHFKAMTQMLDKLFVTFAAFPDFTWEVFDDLIAYQKDLKPRGQLYARLVALYEQASRPDLACEARLKFTDALLAEKRQKEAVEGLSFTIKKFPDEGRYVPRMLDKLEAVSPGLDKNGENLVRFYQEFLPLVPPKRGSDPSPYCMSIYNRAILVFRRLNREDLAKLCETQLQQLQSQVVGK